MWWCGWTYGSHNTINDLVIYHANPTTDTNKIEMMWLDYVTIYYPNAKLCFDTGNMKLRIESLMQHIWSSQEPKAEYQWYLYLHSPLNHTKAYKKGFNMPLHVECTMIKHAVSSVAEVECGGIFHHSSTTIRIQVHSLEWDILNYEQKSLWVIPRLTSLFIQKCVSNAWRVRIWNIIGCMIALCNSNFISNGIKW